MNYASALENLVKYTPAQFDVLFDNYPEASLSWDKTDVVTRIVCSLKLSLRPMENPSEAYIAVEATLARLLHEGKILSKPFGYSALGAEEVRDLLSRYPTEGQAT